MRRVLGAYARSAFLRRQASGIYYGGVAIFAVVLLLPVYAQASDSESLHGELFHRRGWITPKIYQKRQIKLGAAIGAASQGAVQVTSLAARSGLEPTDAKVKRSAASNGGRRSARRARLKTRASSRRQRSARRRIPAKIVKRQERRLRKSVRAKRRGVKVASIGNAAVALPRKPKRKVSVTGGGARVQWVASSRCIPKRLRDAINYVARNYGRVRVNSTCRSRRTNRRVGGARRSWHLKGRAADIRVFGNIRKAARYLRRVAGGYKHYGGGLFHIDTGPRRSW